MTHPIIMHEVAKARHEASLKEAENSRMVKLARANRPGLWERLGSMFSKRMPITKRHQTSTEGATLDWRTR